MRYIRIEDKEYFYSRDVSVTLDNVDNIKRSYDKGFIFKAINIGYQKWSAESASGIDDPQTKKNYATLFKQIGTSASIMSKFFAAGLGIEQTRRNRSEQSKDWRLDDDTMIIALDIAESPEGYYPEFNENFTGISGINNPGSRYNLRITPAWNFLRWINYFRGCLQSYTDSVFKFTGGEGNYDFTATMESDSDCIFNTDEEIAENMDIPVDISDDENDFLHLPDMLDFEYKLNWDDYKTIRDNRNKAIEVSKTDSNHQICHINVLEWKPFDSIAEFNVWVGFTPQSGVTYSVDVYHKCQEALAENDANIYYRINAGAWVLLGTTDSASCGLIGTIVGVSGTSVIDFLIETNDLLAIQFGSNASDDCNVVRFDYGADRAGNYTDYYSITVTDDVSASLVSKVFDGTFITFG
jgi:hypothetical protein